jgi:hypothetical protein
VLSLFRSIVCVLALPFLTVTATADLLPAADPAIASLHATLSISEAKLAPVAVRIHLVAVKRITAQLEDGPEGEEEPIANLLRAYDGDDQIEAQFGFVTISFRTIQWLPNIAGSAPAPSHAPCAGFPTGPPAV